MTADRENVASTGTGQRAEAEGAEAEGPEAEDQAGILERLLGKRCRFRGVIVNYMTASEVQEASRRGPSIRVNVCGEEGLVYFPLLDHQIHLQPRHWPDGEPTTYDPCPQLRGGRLYEWFPAPSYGKDNPLGFLLAPVMLDEPPRPVVFARGVWLPESDSAWQAPANQGGVGASMVVSFEAEVFWNEDPKRGVAGAYGLREPADINVV